ncbi:bifunctional indole-3-glycerol-phosphate synthase TrpC/phosphoribosylanthranilate isomerase TrpF [Sphingomonas xanthus]|nr:bifunctional indole-3-glycerol-phosphate synthase TrpC/phosphoribosylanthranilate isomerase TrpF [Sphingomonas xanthus]
MADVLARIVARKKDEVRQRRVALPPPDPSRRSLRDALAKPGARFVMEVKRRSPSGHVGRHSLEQAVAAYAPVADAISVLTDGADFGGSLDDLAVARSRFDGPILAKDFVVEPFQVAEARAAGADAVLAMLSVLDDSQAAEVMAAAHGLAMDVLVEVHDEGELARAIGLGAEIIGINNRDLKSLRTDLAVTERLAPLVPANALLVAESGIASHSDVQRLASNVDAFLVGSSLMAADDISQAARTLVHGRVKICGITRLEDVSAAARSGATHVGLIMVPQTPRAATVEQALPLAQSARLKGLVAVGVFRDAEANRVSEVVAALQLGAVQLHGKESAAQVAELRALLPDEIEIWTARTVDGDRIGPARAAHRTLFDTMIDGRSGGTGQPFDWSVLAGEPDLSAAFLSGGIGPGNVAAAARVGAYGLDASSRVEASAGVKDHELLDRLFAELRPISRSHA